ncbi:MAG: hypothetical protein ACK6AD_09575 [Cyanobacteriota bacterium]
MGPRRECWYEGMANPDPGCPALELVALVPAAQRGALEAASEALWPTTGLSRPASLPVA